MSLGSAPEELSSQATQFGSKEWEGNYYYLSGGQDARTSVVRGAGNFYRVCYVLWLLVRFAQYGILIVRYKLLSAYPTVDYDVTLSQLFKCRRTVNQGGNWFWVCHRVPWYQDYVRGWVYSSPTYCQVHSLNGSSFWQWLAGTLHGEEQVDQSHLRGGESSPGTSMSPNSCRSVDKLVAVYQVGAFRRYSGSGVRTWPYGLHHIRNRHWVGQAPRPGRTAKNWVQAAETVAPNFWTTLHHKVYVEKYPHLKLKMPRRVWGLQGRESTPTSYLDYLEAISGKFPSSKWGGFRAFCASWV